VLCVPAEWSKEESRKKLYFSLPIFLGQWLKDVVVPRPRPLKGRSVGVRVSVVALAFAGLRVRRPRGRLHQALEDLVVGIGHVVRRVVVSY